jgi:hypothetical protein
MRIPKFPRTVGLCFALAGLGAFSLRAQVTTGTILGNIRDTSGASVVGAQITIKEIDKGTAQTFQTDENGAYYAPFLIPGTYQVNVEKKGFRKQASQNFELQVDQKARVDFTLQVGQVSESIEVTASAPLVKSETAELGEVIAEKAIRELPLNGRNFASLVYMAPAVTPGQQGENLSGASSFNPRAASNFNALGSQANTNAWLVDGIDNNEYTFNTVIVQPSIESVREFKVLTGTFSAAFGRGAGVVSVSTKSGGNEVHGNLFEFVRNDLVDARNYFNAPPQVKPPYRRNQFGGALSGPVYLPKIYNGKNRTFFFMDYSGMRERKGQTFVNTVPDAKTRIGDFSNFTDTKGALMRIYDPLTTRLNPSFDSTRPVSTTNPQYLRDPFAGNVIPSNRINPVGLNVASIYPLPNGPGNFNNYTISVPRAVDDDGFTTRVDHQISNSDSFFVRYSWEKFRLSAPQGQANCCLPTPDFAKKFDLGPYVGGLQVTDLTTQGMAINEAHVFRANLINEFRGGFARTNPYTRQSDLGHNAATSLGIQGVNISQYSSGLPGINVTDFTGLSGGPSFLPANPRETHWQLEDGVSWTVGRHQLKFGYRYVRRMTSPYTGPPGGGPRGDMTFGKNFTNDPVTNTQGTGLATLLLGYISGGNGRSILLEPYYTTNQDHGLYVQDDWKVSQRLMMNIGLRYDVFVPDKEIRNRIVNFDRTTLRMRYAGEDGVSDTAGKQTRMSNLGPRIGLAYDVAGNGRTIIRSGFGVSYFPVLPSGSNMLGEQVPYVVSQTPFGNIPTNPTDFSVIPTINQPFPAITTVKPVTTADLNSAAIGVIGHSFRNETPSMMTWNINVEHQIRNTMVAELTYAGSHSTHLTYAFTPNEIQPGIGTPQSRRLLQPLSNISSMTTFEQMNSSMYHGMSAKLEKRFSSGLQFTAAYTFSKNLDYGGSAASGGGAVGNPQTVTNLRAGRGPSGFDVKHRFFANYVYELPFGKGKRWASSGPLRFVAGGWTVTGITTLSGGRPFTVYLNTGVNNGAPSWPNRLGPGTLSNPDRQHWFNDADFAAPSPNTYGNSARGVLYGPGQVNLDVSFVKNNKFRERYNVQFRFETFNLTNTPFFGFPNANIGAPTVGQITTTNSDNRDLQFALKFEF